MAYPFRVLGILIASIIWSQYLFGQGETARKYSNEFLNIGVDARSMAMGNSVIASTEGVYAGYWNPAGLFQEDLNYDFALMHAEYFASIAQYDYLAGSYKMDERTALGFSLIRFGIDNIQNTLQLRDEDGNIDYDRITRFSAADYAFLLSVGRKSDKIKGLQYGANAKVIYRSLGRFADAFGFGLDAGLQYHSGNWRFGVVGRDITTTVNAWTVQTAELESVFEETGNVLPENGLELTLPKLLIGAGRFFQITENYSLLAELSAFATFDGQRNAVVSSGIASLYPGMGLELGYRNFVFLRGGVGNFQNETDFDLSTYTTYQPSLGIGFLYKGIRVDYAFSDIGNQSGALYSHIFSLRLSFRS
jgi:hypothetical protein